MVVGTALVTPAAADTSCDNVTMSRLRNASGALLLLLLLLREVVESLPLPP